MTHYLVVLIVKWESGACGENFMCLADDADHAREQARNAYPNGEVIGTYELVRVD